MGQQRKGLQGAARLGGRDLHGWRVTALDFDDQYMKQLADDALWSKFESVPDVKKCGPTLFKGEIELSEDCKTDYFVNTEKWGKGLVFVNGFNLGRYWDVGPTKTLYLPAPLLKKGVNEIMVFEEYKASDAVVFDIEPDLGPLKKKIEKPKL